MINLSGKNISSVHGIAKHKKCLNQLISEGSKISNLIAFFKPTKILFVKILFLEFVSDVKQGFQSQ